MGAVDCLVQHQGEVLEVLEVLEDLEVLEVLLVVQMNVVVLGDQKNEVLVALEDLERLKDQLDLSGQTRKVALRDLAQVVQSEGRDQEARF